MLKEEMRITELVFFTVCHGLESSRNRPETKNEFNQFIQATEDQGMRDKKEKKANICVMSRLPLWEIGSLSFSDLWGYCVKHSSGFYLSKGRRVKRLYSPTIVCCWVRVVPWRIDTRAFLTWSVLGLNTSLQTKSSKRELQVLELGTLPVRE